MAFRAAKQRHGTEPTGSPVKLLEQKEDSSPFYTETTQLSTTFEAASTELLTLVKQFFDDAGKTFEDDDFKQLFSPDILGPIRMTTDRWSLFMEVFTATTPCADSRFPILDF